MVSKIKSAKYWGYNSLNVSLGKYSAFLHSSRCARAIPDRRESLCDSKLLEKLLFLYDPEHFHIGNALGNEMVIG